MILKRTENTKTVPIFLLFFLSQVLNASVPEGFLDVTAEPYFADNTGVMDATAALQSAINDARDNNLVLWLPGGTYTISDRLEVDQPDNNPHFPVVMMGSTVNPENRATLVLAANSNGFNDPNARRALLHYFNQGTADNESSNADLFNQAVIGVDFKILSGNDGAVALRMQGAEGCTIQDVNIDLTAGGHTGIWGVPGSGGSTHKVSVTGGVIGIDTRRAGNLGGGGSQPTVVITGSTFTNQSGAAVFATTRGAMVLVGCRMVRDTPGAPIRLRRHWVGQPFDASFHFVDSTVEYTEYNAGNTVVVMDDASDRRSFHFENSYVLHGHHVYTDAAPANPSGWRHYHRLAVHEQPAARSQNINWQPKETVYLEGVAAGDIVIDSTDEAPPADLQIRHQWHEDFPTWEHPGVVNVKDLGAAGDGMTDDWAILQAAIDNHEVVFFPKGTYQVSNTLNLRPDSKLIGSFHTFTRIRAISTLNNRFAGTTEAQGDKPIIRTADTADADTILAFLGIRRLFPLANHNPTPVGNYALEWRSAGSSLLRHVEVESRPNTNVRPDFIAQHYYGYDLQENPINPNHPQLDFQSGHWAWPVSEPTVQIRGHGGGRWFNFSVHGRQGLRSHVPFIRVEDTSEALNFYHFHIQQQDSINHAEFLNASNVSIYGSKGELKGTFAYFQGCNNLRWIGHGGMSSPDPDVNPPYLFRFIDTDNFIIAGLGDTVNEGATAWYGGAFDRWVHTHIRDWSPILDQHSGRGEVQVPWDTRPIVYVRGDPQPEPVSGSFGSGITIHAPRDGSTHFQHTELWFFGTAQTFEEGNFSAEGSWASSLDGPLGSGASVSSDALSIGLHTITFSALSPEGNTLSRSITISLEAPPPSEQTVVVENEPVADAHVRGDSQPNRRRNYGSLPQIETRTDGPGPGYLRFSLAGLPEEIDTAKLIFTTSHTDTGTLNILEVHDTSWTEGGITWNNRPDLGSALGTMSFSGTAGQELERDVRTYINQKIASGQANFGTATGDGLLRFSSREGDAPPRLEISYTQITPVNQPPVVEMLTPSEAVSMDEGQPIFFEGTASDPEDGDISAALSWYSSRDGILGSGATLSVDTLSAGVHTITLHVTDLGGKSGADTLSVTVNPASPTISEQPQDSVVSVGGSTNLTVTASGSNISYQWYLGTSGNTTTPVSGANGASFTTPVLFENTSYWVRVSNDGGHADSVTATVTVNDPPEISIHSPETNENFLVGSIIDFTASAADTEDGDLSAGIAWNSSLDGVLGSGAVLQTGALSVGEHQISATVTDSGGRSDTATIAITILPDAMFHQPFDMSATLSDYVGSAANLFDYIGTDGSENNRATQSIDQGAYRVDIAYTDDGNTSQVSPARLTRRTDLPVEANFAVVYATVDLAPATWPSTSDTTFFNLVIGENFRAGAYNPAGGSGNGPAFTSMNLQGVGGTPHTFKTTRSGASTATDESFTLIPAEGVYRIDIMLAVNAGSETHSFGSPTGTHTLGPGAVSLWMNGTLIVNNATDGLNPSAAVNNVSFAFGSGVALDFATGSAFDGTYWLDDVRVATLSNFSIPENGDDSGGFDSAVTLPSTTTTFIPVGSLQIVSETSWDNGEPFDGVVGLFDYVEESVSLNAGPAGYTIVQTAGTIATSVNRVFANTVWYFAGGVLDMGGGNILHANDAPMTLYLVGGTVSNVGNFRPHSNGTLILETGSFSAASLASDATSRINFLQGATATFSIANMAAADYAGLWDNGILQVDGANTGAFSDHFIVEGSVLSLKAQDSEEEDAYAIWAAANEIEGGATDLTNGVPNLLRYAMGGTAETPFEAFRLVPALTENGMRLSFTRIDDPRLTYEVWATGNLLDWGEAPFWNGGGGDPVEVPVPAAGNQLYLHLRVRRE